MRAPAFVCALAALLPLVWAPTAYPKGSPDRIVITGGGLAHPVEVTDRGTLKRFDPWVGQFIDWHRSPLRQAPRGAWSYEVFFYRYREPRDREMRMIYALRYRPGRTGEPGYVYLPGKAERWYGLNSGTIIRAGHDGRWHHATGAWSAFMERLTTARGIGTTRHQS